MLRGIEVGEQSNFKTAVLLQTLKQEEEIEHLRTKLIYKSVLTDRSNNDDINELNKILHAYNEARNPQIAAERDKAVKSQLAQVKALKNLDLGKVKFKATKTEANEQLENLGAKEEGVIKII
ncbi:MAG: hypothetical protein H8D23_19290 [Candidatus Brocadiales bacterium]|nr:hypothetical protein [Candidatus Brocadiales bacterium]